MKICCVASVFGLWAGYAVAGPWTVTRLHPDGALESSASGVGGAMQVGTVNFFNSTDTKQATLWFGTAKSAVNLHPAGMMWSEGSDTDGAQQVGTVRLLDEDAAITHAALWSGSAGSFVDLHPDGKGRSHALGVRNGQQVGYVTESVGISPVRASLWSGTAESWVELHPVGATRSVAYGVDNGQQVGEVEVGRHQLRVQPQGLAVGRLGRDQVPALHIKHAQL